MEWSENDGYHWSDRPPLVSIVMAVHNEELYLEACIDSILAQSYPKWELIAVNDHSTDHTSDILYRYSRLDPRIRVYNNPGHRLIPALQEAYRHSEGTLINRMDADDLMPSYKIEVLVDEWLKYGKGTIIAGGTSHFVDNGRLGAGFKRYDRWLNEVARRGSHYEEIYQECVIPSHCWIIHRNDFDKIGAFEPEVYPEDYDLCFRFYRQGLQIIGIDRVLHYWRDHEVRISRNWTCYQDNRYFDLKMRYFYEIDRKKSRPLILWGAGRHGKDLAKHILSREKDFHWICDNPKKIGKKIYGVRLYHYNTVPDLEMPQILVAVNGPSERRKIKDQLLAWGRVPVRDFWFFT